MSADRYTDHAEGGATDSNRIDFICAGCEARYKVVHVEADAGLRDHLIHASPTLACLVALVPALPRAPQDRREADMQGM
jgi:hypothetical protein